MKYIKLPSARFLLVVATIILAGCAIGSRQETLTAAVPTDNFDNCRTGAASVSGVSSLFSSSTSGVVKLGMTECELVKVLGEPSQVQRGSGLTANQLLAAPATPGAAAPVAPSVGQRQITLIYASERGGSTGYRFVDNALKEINRL